jgi:rod shape-determining protein MreD
VILTPAIWGRLALLGVVVAILQVVFFSKITVLGASPDVVILVVASIGLLGGSVAGAVAGFSLGLLLDSLLLQTLGASSLALLTVGYLAGRYRESFGRATRGATVLLAGGLTLLGVTAFAAIQVMLGVESNVSHLIIRDAILKGLMAMALILPIYAGIRRLLRPALIDEQRAGVGRRRAESEEPESTADREPSIGAKPPLGTEA